MDVCLASEIIPALLSSESSPTMCHAELFREATGGVVRQDGMLDSDSACGHRSVQKWSIFQWCPGSSSTVPVIFCDCIGQQMKGLFRSLHVKILQRNPTNLKY